jgi:hypothetical protein
MSTAKRQQTMAKRNRERAVEEKRTLKRLKKQAARAEKEKSAGEFLGPDAEAELGTEAESGAPAESAPDAE